MSSAHATGSGLARVRRRYGEGARPLGAAGLGPAARELLDTAAVIGMRAETDLLPQTAS